MKIKKVSYTKILFLLCIIVILVLITGCNGGAPPIEELYGTLDINSTPSGAKVYLDGENTGQVTPIILPNIAVGDHIIELRKFHYRGWEGVVTVIAGQTAYLNPPLPWAPEKTITLQPGAEGKDCGVNQYSPDSENGSWITVWSGYTPSEKTCRAYLQFDLSSVPGNARIIDAYLELYQNSAKGNESFTVGLYQVTSYWGEYTTTWNNQPTSSTMVEASCTVYFVWPIWRIWDNIGDLVQGWLDESIANYGMLLKAITNETSLTLLASFRSSDYTDDPSKRPKLTINYYIP